VLRQFFLSADQHHIGSRDSLDLYFALKRSESARQADFHKSAKKNQPESLNTRAELILSSVRSALRTDREKIRLIALELV
jgi:hypothetical protein